MKTKALFALLIAALVLAQTALAKGPPQKVTIIGPTLPGEVTLTGDQTVLDALGFMSLEDYTTLSSAVPPGLSGAGYLITRFYLLDSGSYVPFDQLRYYPNPAGGRGYLYYQGIVGGWSDYDHHWFRPSAEGEATLQSILAEGKGDPTALTTPLLHLFHSLWATFSGL